MKSACRTSHDTELIRLGPDDATNLANLEAVCFSSPWSEDQLRTMMQMPHFIVYGVCRQGILRAYAALSLTPGEMEILNIATHPDERRQGHARRLLEHVIAFMSHEDVERVFLEVRVGNVPARALYAAAGFAEVGRRPGYYQDTGEDALILCRERCV